MAGTLDGADDTMLPANPAKTLDVDEGYRERSANLNADPKMRELAGCTRNFQDEVVLRIMAEMDTPARRALTATGYQGPEGDQAEGAASSSSTPVPRASLRTDGCEKVNRHMKGLALEKAMLPRVGSNSSELPEEFRRDELTKVVEPTMDQRYAFARRFDRSQTRTQWRESMDQHMRRLMLDMELARDDRLKKSADKVRCQHLDKVYDWYSKHGMKEPQKTIVAPPYVRFSAGGPVMAGSLRVAPKTRESPATSALQALQLARGSRTEPGLGHSASLPSLVASGQTGLETTLFPRAA
mmetsp:Transcript_3597/g.9800  ORF Transcript_3597/g.9800 Transcript_3597/m.9800 type:complete len:297 (-) Transcript_3597:195-1085(-)